MRASVLLLVLAGIAHATPQLDAARKHLKALELENAAASLRVVAHTPGLSSGEVVEYYELLGMIAALQGEATSAKQAFTQLLLLAPNFKLNGRFPPKVTTPFAEAKAIARDRGALTVTTTIGEASDGTLRSVRLELSEVALELVKQLRLSITENDSVRVVTVAPTKTTDVPVNGARVVFEISALGENDWALINLSPVVLEAPAAPTIKSTAPEPSIIEQPPVRAPSTTTPIGAASSTGGSTLRPVAYTLLALSVASATAGLVFGVVSRDARGVLDTPPMMNGVATITRVEALALDQRAQSTAIAATALFIGAGALATGGLITLIIGLRADTPQTTTIAVTPTSSGFMAGVTGSW